MVNKKVLREYIGGMGRGVKLSDLPVELYSDDKVEFHVIISFAIDYTKDDRPRANNGLFQPFWDTTKIDEGTIKSIKDKYPNVKFFLSLGGAEAYGAGQRKANVTFSPIDNKWGENAYSSLVPIITKYHIDGIDIDYEEYTVPVEKFVECIGELIKNLKAFKNNMFFSIAPAGLTGWRSHLMYVKLWESYADKIDYVNFQFYEYKRQHVDSQGNREDITTVDEYKKCYDEQCGFFDPAKIILSFSTGVGKENSIELCMTECENLKKENKLNGIFIWCADTSYSKSFSSEIRAHKFLKGA